MLSCQAASRSAVDVILMDAARLGSWIALEPKGGYPLENERGILGCCCRLSNPSPCAIKIHRIPGRASSAHTNMLSFSRSHCMCWPPDTARIASEGLWKIQPRWAKSNPWELTVKQIQASCVQRGYLGRSSEERRQVITPP